MYLQKVISGGQTGVDTGAVRGAHSLGVTVGGKMPKGWMTEVGPRPEYHHLYNMQESTGGLSQRTQDNINDADATVVIAKDVNSPGTVHTIKHLKLARKSYFVVKVDDTAAMHVPPECSTDVLARWLHNGKYKVVNFAGNRESKAPGIEQWSYSYVRGTLSILRGLAGGR